MIGAFALGRFCKINVQQRLVKFSYKPLSAIIYPISTNCYKSDQHLEPRRVFLDLSEPRTVDQLEIPTGIIGQGYGEYVGFRVNMFGNLIQLSKPEFEKVYAIFNKNSDYQSIKDEIATIDPNIRITFIPRSLYEVVFIRKMLKRNEKEFISQDVENSFCLQMADCHKAVINHQSKTFFYRSDATNLAQIENLAYKINRTICKRIYPSSQGLTYPDLVDYLDNEIESVKEYCKKLGTGGHLCPVYNFQQKPYPRSENPSLGIYTDIDAKLIKASLKLECSSVAHNAFLLYRGGNYLYDFIEKDGYAHSLSYGTGLFAGSLYDIAATPFYYAHKKGNHCYVLIVPFEKNETSPFYIPKGNAIMQLFMEGAHFHARSKLWDSEFFQCSTGMGMKKLVPNINYLATTDSKKELEDKFISYMKEAVILKE